MKKMKKTIYLISVFLLGFVLQIQAQTETVNTVNLSGDAKIVSRKFEENNEKKRFEIIAEFPELIGVKTAEAAKFNQTAKDAAMKNVSEFKKLMLEQTEEDLSFLPEGANNFLEIGYSIERADERLISIHFGRSEYTGGAHPNHWSFTLNFDRRNSRELKLADIFEPNSNYLKTISDYAIADLKKQQEELSYDEDWIKEGAGAKAENFESWNLTSKGLMISFDPYQVAAYAAGGFTVIVPFEKFGTALKPEFITDKTAAESKNDLDGNPENWCRGGMFPRESDDYKIAKIKAAKNERVYFYGDDGDCPNGKNCRLKSYLIPNDEIIISRTYGNFACGWFVPKKGSPTVGWIPADHLEFVNESNSDQTGWLGEWNFYDNSITISRRGNGDSFDIKGSAFWKGLGDNIHIGELDSSAAVKNGILKIGENETDEYACKVTMRMVGRFLVVADNLNCGGANVTFSGVYQKK